MTTMQIQSDGMKRDSVIQRHMLHACLKLTRTCMTMQIQSDRMGETDMAFMPVKYGVFP